MRAPRLQLPDWSRFLSLTAIRSAVAMRLRFFFLGASLVVVDAALVAVVSVCTGPRQLLLFPNSVVSGPAACPCPPAKGGPSPMRRVGLMPELTSCWHKSTSHPLPLWLSPPPNAPQTKQMNFCTNDNTKMMPTKTNAFSFGSWGSTTCTAPGAHWPLWVRILPSRTLRAACLTFCRAPKVEYVLREGEKLKNSFTTLQGNSNLDVKVRP